MEKTLSLYVLGDKPGRLDSYVSEKARLSRTQVQKLIDEQMITLNEKSDPKAGSRLKEGDVIFLRIPMEKAESDMRKQDIPINIIYEDEHIMVVNKDRGMVMHPAPGHEEGTLVNALLYHADQLEAVGDESRPGIVHRIDKNTSGLVIVAKTDEAHQKLTKMFALRKIKKEYLAVLYGRIKGREGVINLPMGRHPSDRKKMAVVPGGKSAVTRWKLKKHYKEWTVISAFPETGRTHQIRVHFTYLGHPLVGDPEYAGDREAPTDICGQALHSYRLIFEHPITGEAMNLEAPIPADLEELIDRIHTLSE